MHDLQKADNWQSFQKFYFFLATLYLLLFCDTDSHKYEHFHAPCTLSETESETKSNYGCKVHGKCTYSTSMGPCLYCDKATFYITVKKMFSNIFYLNHKVEVFCDKCQVLRNQKRREEDGLLTRWIRNTKGLLRATGITVFDTVIKVCCTRTLILIKEKIAVDNGIEMFNVR